jgi:ABC-2 type transport system permease protein
MNPRRTLAITRRLLSQFRHDRRTLAILFITPLVVLGLFAALLRNEDAEAPALAVVNRDEGRLGELIADELEGSDLVQAEPLDEADARDRLDVGDLAGLVVLPVDLTDAAAGSEPLRPEVTLEGTDHQASQRVLAALQEAMPAALAELAAQMPTPPGGGESPAPPELDARLTYLYGDGDLDALDLLGGPFIGMMVFFLVYVVTSVAFLRERSNGTLERLMASPLRRTEIVVGYMIGFTLVALVQAAEVLAFGLIVLELYNVGSVALLFGLEVLLAVAAVSLGIFLSTFARTEFQAVQFIPLIVAPQLLLSGIIVPVEAEPEWLQVVSNVLPLTYAVDAMREVMLKGADLASSVLIRDVAVMAGFCLVVIVAAAATLRREVA